MQYMYQTHSHKEDVEEEQEDEKVQNKLRF